MWSMFLFFLKLGFLSFGGGYALIPMIEDEASRRQWMSSDAFLDLIGVAGMAPGPAAVNISTLIGYQTHGISGAIVAILGLILPSALLTLILLTTLYRLHKQAWLGRVLYGLQPIVTALILFAVYRLGVGSLEGSIWDRQLLVGIFIVGVSWMLLVRYRMHPVFILLFSGICGAAFLA
ncbi:chromate transporter [Paenibacillus paeoniae]|uniref:Chromate transporter n=1 Tax=Paenibacillus paeoniae TaxID=2292705 RepID=A0A371P7B6_9BACL|nr:chromate transporter [Paenibacillus paeoniae]REK71834.1 chromate transporter [Paenibacillus paeoniae]